MPNWLSRRRAKLQQDREQQLAIREQQLEIQQRRREWLAEVFEAIRGGEFPPADSAGCSVILKKGERLLMFLPIVNLMEPRAVRTHGRVGFRVAKGVYIGGGSAESHEELRVLDTGELALTNRRLVFTGSKRVVNMPLGKIVSMEPYRDALAIQRENRQRIQYLSGLDKITVEFSAEGGTWKGKMSGLILSYYVEGAISLAD